MTRKTKKQSPLVVSYGAGVDSTVMLIEFSERSIVPDAIVFADTGCERPSTYQLINNTMPWLLDSLGFPPITVVRYEPQRFKNGRYSTLESQCLVNRTLPSRAFGMGKCSSKWKGEPIDAWVEERFADHIAAGGVVDRAIGYEANEERRCGGYRPANAPHWNWIYPLREWGLTRDDCLDILDDWGLDDKVTKSSCFFCPAMRAPEVLELAREWPELAARAVAIEDAGRPYAEKVTGLFRRPCKGTRGTIPHDGTWRGLLDEHDLLPSESLIRKCRTRYPSAKPEQPEGSAKPKRKAKAPPKKKAASKPQKRHAKPTKTPTSKRVQVTFEQLVALCDSGQAPERALVVIENRREGAIAENLGRARGIEIELVEREVKTTRRRRRRA